ncbi:MAG TPA: asparagine synthase (glutamine-hydrolyzing) [Casimicrobiaceae bacterium]|nr:asparagine synthase (glutamine-hydrolyzing) [Casimicrobiaceae bacterium]
MCGIYGLLEISGERASLDPIAAMALANVHRGPDDEGSYVDGPLAMGMRRLSIIDVAGGHQPLTNEDRSLWLVANGEIYNFRELREKLQARGHAFSTGSDCETLLHLYEEHGDDFLADVNGMFAFALWDVRRQRLVIGRDRLGIKPLYFAREADRRLLFASEAKAILAARRETPKLDVEALHAYLALGYVPAPLSMFSGVEKLPPASLLIAENGRIAQRRYWEVPADVDTSRSETEWVEAIRAQLEASVAMQMVSDVPIGAFLSGGLDSSSVVAFMSRHSDRPVKTYAIGFSGGAAEAYYDELPFARAVAQRFSTDHHEILVRPDVVGLLPHLLWHMDEPVADTAFLTTYLVSEFARRDVTVILSGVGGDELFGGYRRYLGGHYRSMLDRFPTSLRRAAIALGARLPSDRHSPLLNAMRLARGFLATAELPFEERYRSYLTVFDDEEVAELASAPARREYDALARAFAQSRSVDEANRMLAVDLETQLPDDLLLLTDRMSMAVSLECRVPLLDHGLVELAARIPESLRLRGGRLKHLMKLALADVLPPDILERKKRGFGAPMGAWLKRELRPLLDDLLSKAAVSRRGWFRHAAIAKLVADHDANRIDGTDRLLALVNLEVWARLYLDGRSPADVGDELKAMSA